MWTFVWAGATLLACAWLLWYGMPLIGMYDRPMQSKMFTMLQIASTVVGVLALLALAVSLYAIAAA